MMTTFQTHSLFANY